MQKSINPNMKPYIAQDTEMKKLEKIQSKSEES